jgi:hypothetical protein
VEGRQLFVAESQFSLNISVCRGFPGYCALYQRLCELAREATEDRILKSQLSRLKSIVDITRRDLVKQELLRVFLLFATTDPDGLFDSETMNKLSRAQELVVMIH